MNVLLYALLGASFISNTLCMLIRDIAIRDSMNYYVAFLFACAFAFSLPVVDFLTKDPSLVHKRMQPLFRLQTVLIRKVYQPLLAATVLLLAIYPWLFL